MRKSHGPRVLVIYKKSAYEIYVRERRNRRVQELLEAGDVAVRNLKRAHDEHRASMEKARLVLQKLGAKATFRYRSVPVSTDEFDMVVTLGGDGTLLWASHLTGANCPVVAINTAPNDSVGYFCAGSSARVEEILVDAFAGKLPERKLARMRVNVDGNCVSNRVLNDILFCHSCPAAITRFTLVVNGTEHNYKCSGLWVGPTAGSTAALLSAGGEVMPVDSRKLQYIVREPYHDAVPEHDPRAKLVMPATQGFVEPGKQLRIINLIRAGRLFIDGPHQKWTVDIGSTVDTMLSDEPLTILGFQWEHGVQAQGKEGPNAA